MEDKIRLQKYLADAGVCSRRTAEEYIVDGKIKVNGKVVKEMGIKVSNKDKVVYQGRTVKPTKIRRCIMLNKPVGYVTTSKDELDRKCVIDLIHERERYYAIGRLDMYTTGLLLLTNDGELANKVMHPKNEIVKTYVATIDKKIAKDDVEKLREGVDIGECVTKKAEVKLLDNTHQLLEVKISEGKNRQIRRMFETLGYEVKKLNRTQVGSLKLKEDLKIGKYEILTDREIKRIFE
ncbi:MAG: pseudouridine synthase [Clostridia bacterium]